MTEYVNQFKLNTAFSPCGMEKVVLKLGAAITSIMIIEKMIQELKIQNHIFIDALDRK